MEADFEVSVGLDDALAFASLSGDWNPLHTQPEYASTTAFGRPVLHGAYSAGLVSRLAGMHIPGEACLLHNIRMRFVAPVVLPTRLRVFGRLVSRSEATGHVGVTISDAHSGNTYVDASYEFSLHDRQDPAPDVPHPHLAAETGLVLITGASGGLGHALKSYLGDSAISAVRTVDQHTGQNDYAGLSKQIGDRKLDAIVHCGWPAPDNTRLLRLADTASAVEFHLASPLRKMISLARLLSAHGSEEAALVLIGSSFSDPGRHNYRMPLYSLAKGLIPSLTRILALELAETRHRCVAVVYDVIDAGMNRRMTAAGRIAQADRTLRGELPNAEEAAAQIAWILTNRSALLSGATLNLSGGAIP